MIGHPPASENPPPSADELRADLDRLEARLADGSRRIAEAEALAVDTTVTIHVPYKGTTVAVFVDPEDAHLLNAARWFVATQRKSRTAYVRRTGNGDNEGRWVYLHREITGAKAGQFVDHINGNGLDNRRANLRVCTHKENLRNTRKPDIASSSRFKGVAWDKVNHRWEVRIRADGKSQYVGRYDDELEAALAYDAAAVEAFGEFARVNFPGAMVSGYEAFWYELLATYEAVYRRLADTPIVRGGA